MEPTPLEFREQLRLNAAGVIKGLIQARSSVDPEFLSPEDYAHWKVVPETRPCGYLLELASGLLKDFRNQYCKCEGKSIPNSPSAAEEEQHDCLIEQVVEFFQGDLDEASNAAKKKQDVDWDDLAGWKRLPDLRDALDELPEPQASEKDAKAECAVAIRSAEAREVVVNGETKHVTPAGFDVIKVLVAEYPGRLSQDVLISKSKHTDARGILKRLRKSDRDWKKAIMMAETTGRGYGIVSRQTD